MRKELIIIIFAATLLVTAYPGMVSAESAPAVQKALENAKAYIDDLVTAKDDNTTNALALRIETFRQVLDLSSAETKDLEFKLLTIDKDERFETWKQNALSGLAYALAYYDSERDLLSGEGSIDSEKITSIAKDFKEWRESTYLPLVSQIQNFVLLKQEIKAIQVAEKRLQKVNENLVALGFNPDGKDFSKYILKAKTSIGEASKLNKEAEDLFVSLHVALSADTATSSPNEATLSATSTHGTNATSTPPSPSPATSIKDLIKSSLDKIRDAYQSFLDVSGLVRKLLKR